MNVEYCMPPLGAVLEHWKGKIRKNNVSIHFASNTSGVRTEVIEKTWRTTTQCGKREINPHQKIFLEINSLLTSLVRTLLSRNFCEKSAVWKSRQNFSVKSTFY